MLCSTFTVYIQIVRFLSTSTFALFSKYYWACIILGQGYGRVHNYDNSWALAQAVKVDCMGNSRQVRLIATLLSKGQIKNQAGHTVGQQSYILSNLMVYLLTLALRSSKNLVPQDIRDIFTMFHNHQSGLQIITALKKFQLILSFIRYF